MERTNDSTLTGFILVGLSDHPELKTAFFVLVLWMFLMILLGNGVLISVILYDFHLHTPMYVFLCNLSILDICYTSSSVPLVLETFLRAKKKVSFSGCMVQMFLSFATGVTECVLLGMMALDRYVAICFPLRYSGIMTKDVYVPMAAVPWVIGLVDSVIQTSLAMQLSFCSNNVIHHLACEILAVLKLACADISINVISMAASNLIALVIPPASSTCSAHLTVVIIFYGTLFFKYAKPKSKTTAEADNQDILQALISLFYGVVIPLLNPLIYSLRNKDVKSAIKNMLGRREFSDEI
uniref:Olfactory receptor n=1 Tax=Cavia porcellus TaxID=10141 RepID=A0A286X9Z7_CAVPO